ncbi:MAG: hypothetical protein U5M50_02200 [Sphingobium sp.]|nr:hypothetical protein [Sphingobium sp.]
MAQGVDFKGSNKVYRAPEGRDDVHDLHVFVNGRCIVSAWELSDEEIGEIVRSRRVFLSSFSGDVLFPVFVGSESVVRSVVVDYGKVW